MKLMLDLSLSQMLLAAIPAQARLILLGDANQLASVDVGTVLADLQQVPDLANNRVNLVTTRRFAEGAKIGAMAKFIQQEHSLHRFWRRLNNRWLLQPSCAKSI